MLGMPNYSNEISKVMEWMGEAVNAFTTLAEAAKDGAASLKRMEAVLADQRDMVASLYGTPQPTRDAAPVDEALMAQQDAQYATLSAWNPMCSRCGSREKTLGSTHCKVCVNMLVRQQRDDASRTRRERSLEGITETKDRQYRAAQAGKIKDVPQA